VPITLLGCADEIYRVVFAAAHTAGAGPKGAWPGAGRNGGYRRRSGNLMLDLRFTALDPKLPSAVNFCCDAQHTPDLTIW
jgi:hypothetical protein